MIVDLFCNPNFLNNIREIAESLNVHCNAGATTTNLFGDLAKYVTLWFHAEGILNILSLYIVADNSSMYS